MQLGVPGGGGAMPEPFTADDAFQQYGAFAWRTLRYLGVRESDLADAVQDVFLVVHNKLASFQGRSTLRTWIYGICIKRASRQRQRYAQQRTRETLVAQVPDHGRPDAEQMEARHTLHSLLGRLDDDKRTVFVLYEIEQLTIQEVADALGCPLQTAYSRLNAARALMVEMGRKLQEGAVSR